MDFINGCKKLSITILSTIIASIILFSLLSILELKSVSTRVDALESKYIDGNEKIDKIYDTVNQIYWYLINRGDKIN